MPRKLPLLTDETKPFWQGGRSGRLMIYRCTSCGRHFHPPAPICPHCGAFGVSPEQVGGGGRVLSFTVNHQAWTPELTMPYVIAIVELDGTQGVRLVSNIVRTPIDRLAIEMPVQVVFEQHDDVWLPLFEGVPHV